MHGAQVPMEHPSISRLHAVLQFRASDGAAFLYDPGSAHGTIVNKQRIPAQQYVPIRCASVYSAQVCSCQLLFVNVRCQRGTKSAYCSCHACRRLLGVSRKQLTLSVLAVQGRRHHQAGLLHAAVHHWGP